MIVRIAATVVLTAVVAALGEFIIRRNRRSRALREHLSTHGSPTTGTVRTVDKVTTGRYGTHKIRATIDYVVDGTAHTHVTAWVPTEAPRLSPGDSISLLVDPAQPSSVTVAGDAAPTIERDAPYRWFAVGVGLVLLILLLVF